MFRNFLPLFLAAFLAPSLAFAQSSGAPCDFVDQEVLKALQLNQHSMKLVSSKEVGTSGGAPRRNVDVCTFTPPKNAHSPSLSVSIAEMPSGVQALKPTCSEKSAGEWNFATCNASVGNSLVTYVLMGKREDSDSARKAFPIQIERLLKRRARLNSQGSPGN